MEKSNWNGVTVWLIPFFLLCGPTESSGIGLSFRAVATGLLQVWAVSSVLALWWEPQTGGHIAKRKCSGLYLAEWLLMWLCMSAGSKGQAVVRVQRCGASELSGSFRGHGCRYRFMIKGKVRAEPVAPFILNTAQGILSCWYPD